MKKILIAINNDFLRETYAEVFNTESDIKAVSAKKGSEAIDLIGKDKIDLILADISLSEIGGFDLIKKIKEEGKNIPVIVLDQYEDKESRKKALEMEARDFIAFSSASPNEVIRRVKIILGEQKSYRVKIPNKQDMASLAKDLGQGEDLKCSKCGADLELSLIRDLSIGNSHFIVSLVCPNNCK